MFPDVNSYMDVKIVSVNDEYRGLSIMDNLLRLSVDKARSFHVPIIYAICSSFISARICANRLGMKVAYELPYTNYRVNGVNPFLPEKPHETVTVLVKKVE